jgi:hypothetical protein
MSLDQPRGVLTVDEATDGLAQLGDDGQVDWSGASIDSVSVRARRGGNWLAQTRSTEPSPAPSTTR